MKTAIAFGIVAVIALGYWWLVASNDGDGDPLDADFPDDAENDVSPNATVNTLQGNAKAAAECLLSAYPSVVFTSGARDLNAQAHAMATNIVQAGADWVTETYKQSEARDAVVAWLGSNPISDVASVAAGIAGVLSALPAAIQGGISRHLGGQAFDVQPGCISSAAIQTLCDQHKSNGGQSTFLTTEGGLTRWHIQFDDAVTTQFSLAAEV